MNALALGNSQILGLMNRRLSSRKIIILIFPFEQQYWPIPCNPDGGSPSMRKAMTCITGLLFTGRDHAYCRYCGAAFDKPMSDSRRIPRRVEHPSPEKCTKAACIAALFFKTVVAVTVVVLSDM